MRAEYPSTRRQARAWLAGDEDQSLASDIVERLEQDRQSYVAAACNVPDESWDESWRERLLAWAQESADLRVEMLSRIAEEARR